jgi:hypothetical protein
LGGLNAQRIESFHTIKGNWEEQPLSLEKDHHGNFYFLSSKSTYISRYFGSEIDPSKGSQAYQVLAKLDSMLNVIWIKYFYISFPSCHKKKFLVVDKSENIYISTQDSTFKLSKEGKRIWASPYSAEELELDQNENLQLIRIIVSNKDNPGLTLINPSGTILLLDKSNGAVLNQINVTDQRYAHLTIYGKNNTGFYGLAQKSENSSKIGPLEIFITDISGVITKTNLVNNKYSNGTNQEPIYYDNTEGSYCISGLFMDRTPVNSANTNYTLHRLMILKFDEHLDLEKVINLSDHNTGALGYMPVKLLPYEGKIYFGYQCAKEYKINRIGDKELIFKDYDLIFGKISSDPTNDWHHILPDADLFNNIENILAEEGHLYITGASKAFIYEEINMEVDGPIDVFLIKIKDETITSVRDIKDFNTGQKVYPNPVSNSLFINADADFKQYEVINPAGTTILKGTLKSESDFIDVINLPAAYYYLKLINDNKVKTEKFQKL